MPDKNLTIATYAAGAGLAAVALVYVFGPSYLIDNESATLTARSRKNTIVGLINPANDCFINSVLQALAGLGDLRIYLTQETHRRNLGGPAIYGVLVEDPARRSMPAWKIEGLQAGMVSFGLKDMLNKLNERPIWRKTISAAPFVSCLQDAFKQKISRQQQDAQEFLQVLAERLCDEYHAGLRAREAALRRHSIKAGEDSADDPLVQKLSGLTTENTYNSTTDTDTDPDPESSTQGASRGSSVSLPNANGESHNQAVEEGFPFEGSSESQIECSTCGFKPKATKTTFCSLTLSVPQVSSTTLSSCFDQMFKTEYIEDFKCEKCRLQHALKRFEDEYSTSNSEKFKEQHKENIDRIKAAIETNPEDGLDGIVLPDRKHAPKRKIAKHVRITEFPKIMAIHLSRSIFDASRSTMKNSAKVSFPERLPLGGLVDRKFYKLSSVVCHKGSHHSGHYETFRRQSVIVPFSNPSTFKPAAVYSKTASPTASQTSIRTHDLPPKDKEVNGDAMTNRSTPESPSPSSEASPSPFLPHLNGHRDSGESSRNGSGRQLSFATTTSTSSHTTRTPGPTSAPRDFDPSSSKDGETGSIRSIARSAKSTLSSKLSRSKMSSPSSDSTSPTTTTKTNGTNGTLESTTTTEPTRPKKKRKTTDRWWRISDDKVKESKTSDVLSMQREVYLLFYELDNNEADV